MSDTQTADLAVGTRVRLTGAAFNGHIGVFAGIADDGCHSFDVYGPDGEKLVQEGAHIATADFEPLLPLPAGTRVRVKQGSLAGKEGVVLDEEGLTVRADDGEKGYILSEGYTAKTLAAWVEVLTIAPAPAFERYTLVRYKSTNGAKGIVLKESGDEVTVMRVGEHLGTESQDWPLAEVEVDPEPPVVTTDYGDLALGTRVAFGTPYEGMTGTLVGMTKDNFATFLVDEGSDKYGALPAWMNPDADVAEMFSPALCSYAPIDQRKPTGYISKDGVAIYVGDLLEYVTENANGWQGVRVRAVEPVLGYKYRIEHLADLKDYEVGKKINLTASDLRHVQDFSADPNALGSKYRYADGVPIKKGDRVVYDPGHGQLSGISATVIEPGTLAGGPTVRVERDDSLTEAYIWTVGNFSRLQDEDKEKVADEIHEPVEALQRVEQLFERLDSLKDDLESHIDSIGSELSSAEQREVEVEFDSDNVEYEVEVSTDPSRLIGFFKVEGGEVSVEDTEVDSYIREIASVSWSGGYPSVGLESYLTDLHAAFAEGRNAVGEYLKTLDEVRAIVSQVLGTAGIQETAQSVFVTPDLQEFEGKATNVRFGVVLPEDTNTGPALRFDVVGSHVEHTGGDASNTKATRRVRLVGRQIGTFLTTVGVSDVQDLEGRTVKLLEDPYGGWYPTAVSELSA